LIFRKFKSKKTTDKNQEKEKNGIYEPPIKNSEMYGLENISDIKDGNKENKENSIFKRFLRKADVSIKMAKGKKARTVLFWSFCVFAIGGYVFFLNSQAWIPGGVAYRTTELNQGIKMADGNTIEIVRWDYSPSQRIAEIELEIDDKVFESGKTYSIACYSKTNQDETKVNIKPIVQEQDYFVVQMEAPNGWGQLSFYIQINGEKYAGQLTKLYTANDTVEVVDEIRATTKQGYLQKRMQREIEKLKEDIQSLKEENAGLKEKAENIKAKNAEMEENKKYQTRIEIEETEKSILKNKTLLETTEKNISANEKQISENESLIQEIEENHRNMS